MYRNAILCKLTCFCQYFCLFLELYLTIIGRLKYKNLKIIEALLRASEETARIRAQLT